MQVFAAWAISRSMATAPIRPYAAHRPDVVTRIRRFVGRSPAPTSAPAQDEPWFDAPPLKGNPTSR